jgi:hypothetical protein
MFSRRNKKISNQPDGKQIRGKSLADESFDLNSSIGNEAMIENLDLIDDYGDDLSFAIAQEAAWKSREVDLLTQRPPRQGDTGEVYKDPDVNSVDSETTMIKRYDEESDNEVVLKPAKQKKQEKPKKQKKSVRNQALKPVVKKQFANETSSQMKSKSRR